MNLRAAGGAEQEGEEGCGVPDASPPSGLRGRRGGAVLRVGPGGQARIPQPASMCECNGFRGVIPQPTFNECNGLLIVRLI
jgi:hypothetical protein